MERVQKKAIVQDLKKKMVLLAGPRQAGKTTLAKEIAKEFSSSLYLNYDRREDRKMMLEEGWLPSVELLIFDEIHKMPDWKNYLKGVYDTKPSHQKILVTGSARLEIYQQVGDSLAGRYFLHRLFPLSPSECRQVGVTYSLDHFLERGSFPEPFLAETPTDAKRWRRQYIDSLLREDVLDFDQIQNIKAIRLVFDLLRERVGSPISYSSIAQDVAISPNTVKKYLQILEALYVIFRVPPYSRNIARSLLKEPKIYFFDTGLVKGDEGIKFENLVALCLLKALHAKIDMEAKEVSLHYLRTKEHHEVDFAVVEEDQILEILEVKWANHTLGKGLCYFSNRYDIPGIQIVKNLKRERRESGIELRDGMAFLQALNL